ncbi:hypothetical protein ACOME3_007595 [Neoechinorhynchus agilis]
MELDQDTISPHYRFLLLMRQSTEDYDHPSDGFISPDQKTLSPSATINPEWLNVLKRGKFMTDPVQIENWYRKFLIDCPDGLLSKSVFNGVFSSFYNERKANLLQRNVTNALKKETFDFLDYMFTLNMLYGLPLDRLRVSIGFYLLSKQNKSVAQKSTLNRDDARYILSLIACIFRPAAWDHERLWF